MKKQLQITIEGNVQGVFFRKNTKEKARQLGVTGFVKNEPDGTVYIEAEGEDAQLQKLVSWCKSGPDLAHVKDINVETKEKLKNYSKFEIRY